MPLSQRAFLWQKELSRPISVQIFQNSTSAMTIGIALALTAMIPGVTSHANAGICAPISRIRMGKISIYHTATSAARNRMVPFSVRTSPTRFMFPSSFQILSLS